MVYSSEADTVFGGKGYIVRARVSYDLTPKKEMVGAWGFEPQTPTVSR